jgi:hypothetical protein
MDLHSGFRADLRWRPVGCQQGFSGYGFGTCYAGGKRTYQRGSGHAASAECTHAGLEREAEDREKISKKMAPGYPEAKPFSNLNLRCCGTSIASNLRRKGKNNELGGMGTNDRFGYNLRFLCRWSHGQSARVH